MICLFRRQADEVSLGTLLYEIYVVNPENDSSLLSYGVDPLFPPGYLPFFLNSSINIDGLVFDSFLSYANAGDVGDVCGVVVYFTNEVNSLRPSDAYMRR